MINNDDPADGRPDRRRLTGSELRVHADVAALMLAAADDRQASLGVLKTVSADELAPMLLAALDVAATLIRHTDAGLHRGDVPTTRRVLAAVIDACRDQVP